MRHIFFATCAPGIEPLLHEELRALRMAKIERQVGGVHFEGTLQDAWRANLWLRTAVRVLLRVDRFRARDGDELYAGVGRTDWTRFLAPEGSLVVQAHTRDSAELDHSLFVAQRVKDAVVDQLRSGGGARPSVDKEDPDVGIHVHLFRERCTLLVDTSGGSLHRRGWRRFQGRAPLAETLASALLQFSGWDLRAPLIDPFCGSGTLLIEGALMAAGAPPGGRVAFGFERWPGHDARAFDAARRAALASTRLSSKRRFVGLEREPRFVEGARENVASAGLEGHVTIEVGDAADLAPRPGWGAWIATNPPYGKRVGESRGLRATYRDFGRVLRERCAGFHLALFSGDPDLAAELGVPVTKRVPLKNGSLDCELLLADL